MRDHIAIFSHHIYEFRKGLRRLVLYTGSAEHIDQMTKRLELNDIAYHFAEVTSAKVNCFFGDPDCIEVIRSFGNRPLQQLTEQEDFILGVLLGYDLKQQCQRYLSRKKGRSRLRGGVIPDADNRYDCTNVRIAKWSGQFTAEMG